MALSLQAKAIKATVVLDPSALIGVDVPVGQPKFRIMVSVAGRTISADLNAKSMRRCVSATEAAGPDGVAVVLSGKLEG
jgi:hypothetical protein